MTSDRRRSRGVQKLESVRVEGVPAEIQGWLQAHHAFWSDGAKARAWFTRHGFAFPDFGGRVESAAAWRDAAAEAWASANGFRDAVSMDHAGLRALGVTFAGSRRLREPN